MKALIDRAAIDAQIAGLAQEHGAGTAEFRKGAVEVFAEALARGVATARRALEEKGSGLACGAHIAFVEDELLRSIHSCVIKYIHRKRPRAIFASSRWVVMAAAPWRRGRTLTFCSFCAARIASATRP